MNKEEIFKSLFHKVAMSKFSIESIDEINAFSLGCNEKSEHVLLTLKAENLISLIYFNNNYPAESLEIDLKLVDKLATELPEYSNTLLRATKTSAYLNGSAEVSPYVLNFLKNSKPDFYTIIPLLSWYVEFNSETKNNMSVELETVLSTAALGMGIIFDNSKSFTEQVFILFTEFNRGNKDLHNFRMNYQNASEEHRQQLVMEYIENEPLGFFRQLVIGEYKK